MTSKRDPVEIFHLAEHLPMGKVTRSSPSRFGIPWRMLTRTRRALPPCFLDTSLADPCHRRGAHLNGVGDHRTGAAWSPRSFIRFEQDTGMGEGPGRSGANRHGLLQQEALSFGEGDAVHLDHRTLQVGDVPSLHLSLPRFRSSVTDQ
jgi:hypothetical protein